MIKMRLFERFSNTLFLWGELKKFNVWYHDIWCCTVATPVTLIMNAAAKIPKNFPSRNQTETSSSSIVSKTIFYIPHYQQKRTTWNNKKCFKLVSEIGHWMSWTLGRKRRFSFKSIECFQQSSSQPQKNWWNFHDFSRVNDAQKKQFYISRTKVKFRVASSADFFQLSTSFSVGVS